MPHPQLEAPKTQPSVEEVIEERDDLRRQLRGLKEELREKEEQLEAARSGSVAAVKALKSLRIVLEPIHKALKMVFGELDAAGIETEGQSESISSSPGTRSNLKWESWRQRLGGRKAEFIDLLLVHGEMSHKQLGAANHCSYQTSVDTIAALNKAGIIHKSGGKFSLKDL